MWKRHRCYGFIINCTFETKKNYLSKVVWYFIGVYIINRTRHGRLEIRNFSSRVEYFWNIFEHSKRVFASPRGHIISSMYTPCLNNGKSVSLLLFFLNFDHYHQTNVNIFLFWRRPQSIKSYYTTMKNTLTNPFLTQIKCDCDEQKQIVKELINNLLLQLLILLFRPSSL